MFLLKIKQIKFYVKVFFYFNNYILFLNLIIYVYILICILIYCDLDLERPFYERQVLKEVLSNY